MVITRGLLGAAVFLVACGTPSVPKPWGRDASEQFSDPRVAGLANAACIGDVGGVEMAIRDGADANFVGLEGRTPLHWAVVCDNARGVGALLRAGANPNLKPEQDSATYLAALWSSPAVLALLLRSGGDFNSYQGDDPALSVLYASLQQGVATQRWENWRLLLDAGADIEQHDEMGDTVAIHALDMRAYDQVIELLERGYDFRLNDLGYAVQMHRISQEFPEAIAKLARIRRMLEERGVRFPVSPPWEHSRE